MKLLHSLKFTRSRIRRRARPTKRKRKCRAIVSVLVWSLFLPESLRQKKCARLVRRCASESADLRKVVFSFGLCFCAPIKTWQSSEKYISDVWKIGFAQFPGLGSGGTFSVAKIILPIVAAQEIVAESGGRARLLIGYTEVQRHFIEIESEDRRGEKSGDSFFPIFPDDNLRRRWFCTKTIAIFARKRRSEEEKQPSSSWTRKRKIVVHSLSSNPVGIIRG